MMAFTDEEKRQFEWLVGELRRQFVENKLAPELLLQQLEFITRRDRHECDGDPVAYPMAHRRCLWFDDWYRGLGFEITIPLPHISDDEFERRAKKNETLFYRPSTSEVSYKDFMRAVGDSMFISADGKTIGWEKTKDGYWFWAEISEICPRKNVAWNDLIVECGGIANRQLISLEEYVIVWYVSHKETGTPTIDVGQGVSWTWLRTRFDEGSAIVQSGVKTIKHCVYGKLENLAHPLSATGGRVVEIVAS